MRRIIVVALATALVMAWAVAYNLDFRLSVSRPTGTSLGISVTRDKGDSPGEAAYRTAVKTQLVTQPGMNLFCQAIRGSSDREVLALMVEIVGQDEARMLNLSPGNDAQLRAMAIFKEECSRIFGGN